MISRYDYLNIAVYVAFIISVGIYYARQSKNTSDYFRGGGVMPWWITGAAAWMGSFTAWTFTGAAGKIYETGTYVLILYLAGLPALFVLLGWTCYRFRRMRVVTPLEAVRLRYGPGAQQFYTWIRLPFLLFFGGVSLTSVSVFMAAVFNIPLNAMIIALGLVVVTVSMLGGTFAVAASDFVQMFLVVSVTIVTSVLALHQPGIGGVSGLISKVPPSHLPNHWSDIASPGFMIFWMIALTINNIMGQNSMENSAKYLMTRSDRHARLMLIIPIVGTILGPIIWIIPPMVTAVTHKNLGGQFPGLAFPHEAAFLATAHDVLPNGMLGLLICGIFAATLTGMDASLNQAAGIFVRNFYLPIINRECPEKKLLGISKVCTAIFGAIIITVAVIFSQYRTLGLFDLLNQLGVSLWLPLAIPLVFGMFYQRTPGWSTWSTVLIGLSAAMITNASFNGIGTFDDPGKIWLAVNADGVQLTKDALKLATANHAPVFYIYHGAAWLGGLPGVQGMHLHEEVTALVLFTTVGIVLLIGVVWFFFTSLFYQASSPAYKADVQEFFDRVRQPLLKDQDVPENTTIEVSIGRLCMIYGGVVMLMAAIPNLMIGRLCFIFCGGLMAGIGLLLFMHYRVVTKVAVPNASSKL